MAHALVNGVTLAFDDVGSGPALIFCHGFLMDRSGFAPQVDDLRENFRCITWDQRGFGQTKAVADFTLWDSAADAVGLLDKLQIEKAVFIGASQGGYVGLRAALAFPDRVKALVLIGSEASAGSPEAREGTRALFEAWASDQPLGPIADGVGDTLFGSPQVTEKWKQKWLASDRKSILIPGRAVLERDDLTSRMSEVRQPALIINGDADPVAPLEVARQFQSQIANSRDVVVVEGGAHAPYLTHPEFVTSAIRTFLENLSDT